MKGKRSSMNLMQLMSDQNAHARGEEPVDRSERRSEEEVSEWIVPHVAAPTPQAVTEHVEFFQHWAGRAQSGEASEQEVESALSNRRDLEGEASFFFWSPDGQSAQKAVEEAQRQIAESFPDLEVKGTPLAFTVALTPLFEAMRTGFRTHLPDIAADILDEWDGENIAALDWIRSMANG